MHEAISYGDREISKSHQNSFVQAEMLDIRPKKCSANVGAQKSAITNQRMLCNG